MAEILVVLFNLNLRRIVDIFQTESIIQKCREINEKLNCHTIMRGH